MDIQTDIIQFQKQSELEVEEANRFGNANISSVSSPLLDSKRHYQPGKLI